MSKYGYVLPASVLGSSLVQKPNIPTLPTSTRYTSSLCLLGSPSFSPPSFGEVLSDRGAGFPRLTISSCHTFANVGWTTSSTQSGTSLVSASGAGGASTQESAQG